MKVARFVLIVALVASSLGLSSLCLDTATCAVPEVTAEVGCHDEGPVMGTACCCSDEIGSDQTPVVTDRQVASASSLYASTTESVTDGANGTPRTSIEDRSRAGRMDRQTLYCVSRT